jgi:hypothetical protein
MIIGNHTSVMPLTLLIIVIARSVGDSASQSEIPSLYSE